MPMPDQMGFEFTGTQKQDIINSLSSCLTTLNGIKTVQLTGSERQGAQSLAEGRFPYVQKAVDNLAPTYPNLQPGFMDLPTAQRNLTMSIDMGEILLVVKEIVDRFTDFGLASEHFAYEYMRKLYEQAKSAQSVNTPGADVVVNELAPLFEKQGQSNSEDLPPE